MSKVPKNLQNDSISEYLLKNNYVRIHQGKVRDTYFIDEEQKPIWAMTRKHPEFFFQNIDETVRQYEPRKRITKPF